MKGIQVNRYGGPEVLEYVDLLTPILEPHQLLIQIEGTSVNYADLKARSGEYHLGKKPPFIPGIDVAGTVIGIGGDIENFSTGDRVIAFPFSGSYAEKVIADEKLTFSIPDSLDAVTAAAFPLAAGAAMHMLTYAAMMKKGESVLVHGASGGVGSMLIQLVRILGASKVVGTTSSEGKNDFIRGIGADDVLNLTDREYMKSVKCLSEGKGFDVILNPIGGESISQDLKNLAPFGRLITFGKMIKESTYISPATLHTTNRSIVGFSFGHYRKYKPDSIKSTINYVLDLVVTNDLKVCVDKCFPLEKANMAHQYMETKSATGKIVLLP